MPAQNKVKLLLSLVMALGAMIGVADTASAGVSVTPIMVKLSKEKPIATLKFRNSSAQSALVEVTAFEWTQSLRSVDLTVSDMLLVSKPVFKLGANETTVIRLAILGEVSELAGHETAFRIFVDQTALDERRDTRGGVDFKIRHSIPVFVGAAPKNKLQAPNAKIRLGGNDKLDLEVNNPNWGHIKIRKVSLFSQEGKLLTSEDAVRYVLGGAQVILPVKNVFSPSEASGLHSGYALLEYTSGRSRYKTLEKRVQIDPVGSIYASTD